MPGQMKVTFTFILHGHNTSEIITCAIVVRFYMQIQRWVYYKTTRIDVYILNMLTCISWKQLT